MNEGLEFALQLLKLEFFRIRNDPTISAQKSLHNLEGTLENFIKIPKLEPRSFKFEAKIEVTNDPFIYDKSFIPLPDDMQNQDTYEKICDAKWHVIIKEIIND